MDKELFDFVAQRVDVLATSDFSTQVTKDAARAWKEAVAADGSDAAVEQATTTLLDIMEGRPTTVDGVIEFAKGAAVELFGEEAAGKILATQLERKAQGEKWCDCAACVAAVELLAKFGRAEL